MNSIAKVYALAKQAGNHNYEGKEKYVREGRAFLRRLAKDLNLLGGDYEIRVNRAGPAVSGEVTLHHEAFYLQFSETGCMFRSCKSQRDYTGGPNNWAVFMDRASMTYSQLCTALTRELVARGF